MKVERVPRNAAGRATEWPRRVSHQRPVAVAWNDWGSGAPLFQRGVDAVSPAHAGLDRREGGGVRVDVVHLVPETKPKQRVGVRCCRLGDLGA